jgi:hypothetical protein
MYVYIYIYIYKISSHPCRTLSDHLLHAPPPLSLLVPDNPVGILIDIVLLVFNQPRNLTWHIYFSFSSYDSRHLHSEYNNSNNFHNMFISLIDHRGFYVAHVTYLLLSPMSIFWSGNFNVLILCYNVGKRGNNSHINEK